MYYLSFYIVYMCVEVSGILEHEIYPPSKLQVYSTILWTIILILKSEYQNLNLFVCIFLRQSPVSQAALKLPCNQQIDMNFWSSCPYLLGARISDMGQHTQLQIINDVTHTFCLWPMLLHVYLVTQVPTRDTTSRCILLCAWIVTVY